MDKKKVAILFSSKQFNEFLDKKELIRNVK